jgi:hypothetical protein
MKVLAPLISGKENFPEYIEAITSKVDKIILLQVVDKEFMNKTSTAMGEIMHFHKILEEVKKEIGKKRKTCEEITEWGNTAKKVVSISFIQQTDKVLLINQNNHFFKGLLEELKKNKIKYELVSLQEEINSKEKNKGKKS